MQRLADDTRIPAGTLKTRRWVSSRWPAEHRRASVSWSVHRILADEPDAARRWALIDDPPLNERTGRREWTDDAAKRVVGQKVNHPVTETERVKAIHDMAADEGVAARAVTDLLRRPEVAAQAMGDPVARHMVNRAKVDRAQQAVRAHLPPAARPALENLQQAREFLDLVARWSGPGIFGSRDMQAQPAAAGEPSRKNAGFLLWFRTAGSARLAGER